MSKWVRALAAAFGFAAFGALFFGVGETSAVAADPVVSLCAGSTCGPNCSGVLVSCNCKPGPNGGAVHCDICCSK